MGFQRYSEDLKLLAVRMALDGDELETINQTLRTSISATSLWRWKELHRRTERVVVDPREYKTIGRPHALSDEHLGVLHELVTGTPTVYIDELQRLMLQITGLRVSQSTIGRDLHQHLGLSHLVARGVHSAQSIASRTDYMIWIGGIPPEYLVFIDESGIKGRDCIRTKAWAPKGTRSVRQKTFTKQDHWTILPAVCEQGIIAGTVIEGPVEIVHVELFLERDLLPVMNRYPAVNSVLVLDNARIHHGGLINKLCKAAGVLLVYLPAYSPDLNPIEISFNSMKAQLRREQRWFEVEDRGEYLLLVAGKVMTQTLLQPLIAFSGYATADYWQDYNAQFDH